jgi:ribosomal protein L39E
MGTQQQLARKIRLARLASLQKSKQVSEKCYL